MIAIRYKMEVEIEVIKTGLKLTAAACAATMAMPAMAEPLYLTYIAKSDGNGRASLVYPTLKECRSTTGLACVKPKLVVMAMNLQP